MTQPKFVNESQDVTFAWIPEYDALYLPDGSLCENENAHKFWIINCKIRNTLLELRSEIEVGGSLKVNISVLAKKSGIKRVSLYHDRRKWWIKDQIEDLNQLKGRLSREKIRKEFKEIKQLDQLISSLKLSREQVAKLTFEKIELLKDLDTLERKIKMLEKTIFRLTNNRD